jgi:group I intron endonuclease
LYVLFLCLKIGDGQLICGIYCISNVENNKKYIGQSKNIEIRWKQHISDLTNNNHGNSHLQNSWNTYGSKSFSFSIIEYCTEEELTEREDYWIKYYDTLDRKYGYNLREAGSSGSFRPESIERMRKAQLGKWVGENNSAATITDAQAIDIIDLLMQGKKIREIEDILNIPYKTIYHIRNKEHWTHLTEGIEFPCYNSSKYKGVHWEASVNKWCAKMNFNKQRVYLEYFDDEIEAAKARDIQARKYFGDKAKLNFPN